MANIVLSDKAYISGLEKDEVKRIKEELTLPNPKYEAAKKYSRYERIYVPQYLRYYTDFKNGSMSVPIGFNTSKHACIESIRDERITIDVNYPTFQLKLRDDQNTAAKNYIIKNKQGHAPQGIITLPTGKGKTVVGLYLAYKLKQKTLI